MMINTHILVLANLKVNQLRAKKLKVIQSLFRKNRRIKSKEERAAVMGQVYKFTEKCS